MSAPRSPQRRPPLNERSQSQNNALAIRIVPYTPPRLQAEGGDGAAQPTSPSRPSAPGPGAKARISEGNDQDDRGGAGYDSHPSWFPFGPPLASGGSQGVSGPKVETRRTSGEEGPATPTVAPPLRSPSHYDTDISPVNGPLQPDPSQASLSSLSRPLSRRRNFVALHSGTKTFSLVPLSASPVSSDYGGGFRSPPLSYSTRTSGSHEGHSSGVFSSDGRPSSPLTSSGSVTDRALSASAILPGSPVAHAAEDPTNASPWNYRLVGGLRKVPKTPDPRRVGKAPQTPLEARGPLPVLSEATVSSAAATTPEPQHSLTPQASFNSLHSASTISEATNYKLYGYSSPPHGAAESPRPSSSHSDFGTATEPSGAAPPDAGRPATSDSDQNYVVHGDPSPSSSLVATRRRPRPTYSQESLLVPPLQPRKKDSRERIGYLKSTSRDRLRVRAGSIKSIRSISSIISDGVAAAFLAGQPLINIPNPPFPVHPSSHPGHAASQQDLSWDEPDASSTPPLRPAVPRIQMQPATPHQWSSQLSTVMSESEGGSSLEGSRAVSSASGPPGGGAGRRSSRGWASSTHSRQMPSISSSIAAELEPTSRSRSGSRAGSIERPQPSYVRSGQGLHGIRMVRDQDEHGDGLTDLHEISPRPSRTGLSGLFTGSNLSERNLHSSASSRSLSLNSSSLPAWARVYYGSGERRFLAPPSEAAASEPGDSRPSSISRTGSPATDHFPLSLYSPRRRARDAQPSGSQPFSGPGSMDIAPLPPAEGYHIRRGLRKITSSIWSPHLHMDRRATRYSLWEPPSVSWSAESGLFGRRNIQVVMFTVGFIFPFAWMIAAVLQLPPKAPFTLLAGDESESRFRSPEDTIRPPGLADDVNYQSARWWRTLNRCMSVVGLLIIGAIVALVVVSVQEGWSHR